MSIDSTPSYDVLISCDAIRTRLLLPASVSVDHSMASIDTVECIESVGLYIIVSFRAVECFNYDASVHGYILLYSLNFTIVDAAAGAALGRSLTKLRGLEDLG